MQLGSRRRALPDPSRTASPSLRPANYLTSHLTLVPHWQRYGLSGALG